MWMNDALIDAFSNRMVPRKRCRRKDWPPRIWLHASRPISDHAADVELMLILSAEVGYNEEDSLTINYTPTTEDICAEDWEVV